RRRVQGAGRTADDEVRADRQLVEAFLAASREGDMAGLLAILDPEVVLRPDAEAVRLGGAFLGGATEVHGAQAGAQLSKGRAQAAVPGLIDGSLGIRVAPHGRLLLVLRPTFVDGRIVAIEAVADHASLADLRIEDLPA